MAPMMAMPVMAAPVVMPRPVTADLARSMVGPDDSAEAARAVGVRRRITVIARTEMTVVPEMAGWRIVVMPRDIMMPRDHRCGEAGAAAAVEAAAMKGAD